MGSPNNAYGRASVQDIQARSLAARLEISGHRGISQEDSEESDIRRVTRLA